jgi:hypothetical protein
MATDHWAIASLREFYAQLVMPRHVITKCPFSLGKHEIPEHLRIRKSIMYRLQETASRE